jgi:hypothetical protein
VALTELAGTVEFDLKEFKAMDKACQGLYAGYKRGKQPQFLSPTGSE